MARGLADGFIYHVLNRGNGRQQVFHEDKEYEAFIELMSEAKTMYEKSYHADGLGAVVALTDSSGKIQQTYEYDSFGNLKDLKWKTLDIRGVWSAKMQRPVSDRLFLRGTND